MCQCWQTIYYTGYASADCSYGQLILHSFSSGEIIAASQVIDVPADSLYVSFSVFSDGPAVLVCGVLNGYDTATFVPIDTVITGPGNETRDVDFSTLGLSVSGDLRIGFKVLFLPSSNHVHVIFDHLYIDRDMGCVPPHNVHVSYADSSSVTLAWDNEGQNGFVLTLDDTVLTTTVNLIDVNDLLPNHSYYYRLQALCSDSVVSPYREGYFRTECQKAQLPFSENFDITGSSYTQALDECWHTVYNNSTYAPVITYLEYDNSALRIPNDCLVATPLLAVAGNNMHVTFDVRPRLPGVIEAGVIRDLDTATFVPLIEYRGDAEVDWETVEFYTEDLLDTVPMYVAFRWQVDSGSFSTITGYVDNLHIEAVDSCHAPSVTYVDTINAISVNLRWVDHSITPGYYELRYGTENNVENADTSVIILDTFFFITDMQYGTNYYFWVRSLCDSTHWVPFESFRTVCGLASLPYEENFESYNNDAVVPCWRYIHTDTTSANPYITHMSGLAHSGNGLSLHRHSYDTLTMMLPAFGTHGDELEVSFRYTSTRNQCVMKAGLTNMVSNTFVPAIVIQGQTNDGYYVFATDSLGITDSVRVTFVFYDMGYGQAVDACLDDVNVRFIPVCRSIDSVSVSNITDTDAIVHIHDHWNIGYYRVEFTNGSYTDTVYSYSPDVTIGPLVPSMEYTLIVNGICFDGSLTDTFYANFVTSCAVISHDSLPYIEDFDIYPNAWTFYRPCWNVIRVDNAPGSLGTQYPLTTVGRLIFGVKHNEKTQIVVMPEVDSLDDLYVEFMGRTAIGNGVTMFEVGIIVDSSDLLTFTPLASFSPQVANMWETYDVPLGSYAGIGRRPAIRVSTTHTAGVTQADIDNLSIRVKPRCSDSIFALASRDVGATCATFEWKVNYADNMESHYIIHLLDSAGSQIQTHVTTESPYTLCNLDPKTSYRVYVELYCDGGVVATSSTLGFTTQCMDYNLVSIGGIGTNSTNYPSLPIAAGFNTSMSQQLYFADEMQNIAGTLTEISFRYQGVNAIGKITGAIYMAHTSDTAITGMMPLSNMTAVYSGPLNLREGWTNISFNTPFHYNGVDNLIICVTATCDNPLPTGMAMFKVRNVGLGCCLYKINDGAAMPAVMRNSIRFNLCPDVVQFCQQPTIEDVEVTDHSITVHYIADSPCEVHIHRGWWNRGFSGVMDTSSSQTYTFDGLRHSTVYTVGVRKHCVEGDTSLWALRRISTTNIDALPPDTIMVDDITLNSACVTWTRNGNENMWRLHFFNGVVDTVMTLTDTTYTFTGLNSLMTYNASVCGVYGSFNDVISPWGDTVTFTTDYCRAVSDIVYSEVTVNSARVSWTPGENGDAWRVEYGFAGYDRGDAIATIFVQDAPTAVITELEPESVYDVHVATVCDSSHSSGWTTGDPLYTPDANGSVLSVDDDNAAFVLYPNPASTTVTIRWKAEELPSHLDVIDANGRVAMHEAIVSSSTTLSLDGLQAGIYFVRLTGAYGTSVRKLVVNR